MKRWLSGVLSVIMLLSLFVQYIPTAHAAEMTASQDLVDFIIRREGFSPTPYKDNTHYSIGYGTTCPDNMVDYYTKNPMTEEEARAEFVKALNNFESAINKLAQKLERELTQNQFDALVSFCYNCGTAWTTETTGYMYNAVKNDATGSDFIYAMCLWSSSGGDFILIKRRLCESDMYFNGVYSTTNTYADNFHYIFLDGNGGEPEYVIQGYDSNDPTAVKTKFSSTPKGCTFAGWATADGTNIETLDGSLPDGTILYAKWVDANGETVTLSKGTAIEPLAVTITAGELKVRSGPGTYYTQLGTLKNGTTVTITETYASKSALWGKFEQSWISLSYTNYEEALSAIDTWPKNGIVNADGVNVRAGAGTSYESKYKLNTGDSVTIYEQATGGNLKWGRLEDGNWICLSYVTFTTETTPSNPTEPTNPTEPSDSTKPSVATGDINNDGKTDKDDAIYLLRHVLFPNKYPVSGNCDTNGDGKVDKDDAIYLLRHVLFPNKYPLT